MKKSKSAAILTINSPGNMHLKGRKDIAKWLHRQANLLVQEGDAYTKGRFTARFSYMEV